MLTHMRRAHRPHTALAVLSEAIDTSPDAVTESMFATVLETLAASTQSHTQDGDKSRQFDVCVKMTELVQEMERLGLVGAV
jgi:hypothetical protein